jgi:6-phosphofructokinase 2
MRIVTLTPNPALDCSCEAETVMPIHKVRTFNEVYAAGGGGINVARAIRQLGGEATALYLAGGATGVFLDQLVDEAGVTHQSVDIAGNTRVSHNVFERSTRLDYRFVPEGPLVSKDECDRLLEALGAMSADAIIGSGSLPRGADDDFFARAADAAKAKGAAFYLDTSGAALKAALTRGGVALVKPSLGELSSITGRKLETRAAQEAAAMEIVNAGGARLVAVTLGRDGGFLASGEGIFTAPAPSVKALSAVGAGDSFLAGMVLALSNGRPLREAFVYAMAAGAAAVLHIGTQLCKREDVEAIYAGMMAGIEDARI